ncbi:MAG: hypothetical protein EOP00_02425, partial [Pedobacter sp.]
MRKITLLLFALIALTYQSFAQTSTGNTEDKKQLLRIKSVLEKHFAGTNVRSLQKYFEIKQAQSNGYSFISEVNGLFSEESNKVLSSKLNRVLKLKNNTKLTGLLYFNDCIDSVLVSVEYKRDDTVYNFISMSGYAVPRGGFKAFSKRLHDFVKEQITLGKLMKDSVIANTSISILVDKNGSLKQNNQSYLSRAIDVFLTVEPRWYPSMASGRPISTVTNFSILRNYIEGDIWPIEDYISKNHQNYNDFDGYVNIYTIAFFHDQNIPIFYSDKLLQHSGKTIASAVYDNMLKEYRMIVTHNGSLTNSNQLINLIKKEASKKFSTS